MNINPENIPSIVYDWIKQFAFAELHPAQQAEVEQYLTADEYDRLHRVHNKVSGLSIPAAGGKEERKKLLLATFDATQKHNKGFVYLLNRPVVLWKAAAVFVLVLSAWVFFYLNESKAAPAALVAQTDTVYVTKEIPAEPLKIHDTVYVDKYRTGTGKKEVVIKKVEMAHPGTMSLEETVGTGTVSVKELDSKANLPKGNSMKDDTLLRRYSFVTM